MNDITFKKQITNHVEVCTHTFANNKRWTLFLTTFFITLLLVLVIPKEMFTEVTPTKKGAFALVCACIWTGLFNSIQSIVKERDVLKHEVHEGLKTEAYVGAHMIFESMMCLAETLIVSAVVFVRYGKNISSIFVYPGILITFFLIIYSSDVLGLMISAVVRKAEQAMTVMPFVLIIQLLYAGLIFELKGISDKISSITISKWGWRAILNMTLGEANAKIWESTEEGETHFLLCWILLILFTVLYGFLASVLLKFVKRDKR